MANEAWLARNKKGLQAMNLQAFGNNGAPGEIRTPDHLVRSQVLYPAELRAHQGAYYRRWGILRQPENRTDTFPHVHPVLDV